MSWFQLNNFFPYSNFINKEMLYTAPKLIELLEQQHQQREKADLFKQGIFTIQWRAKCGSHPHPDLETMIPASEPCGTWKPSQNLPHNQRHLARPEAKRNVGENYQYFRELPYRGYIPASSIRGLVRAWATKQSSEIKLEMERLLGKQENDTINSGKIEFLDAYPTQETKVTLDIVNPQQPFQVYHDGQSTPLSFYTLGDGEKKIRVKVAIRGIEGKAKPEEVTQVWGWVEQALSLYGIGSRTASGYGAIKANSNSTLQSQPNHTTKTFTFSLYSQGCGGASVKDIQLRPSHWRGWLRSWVLRFLLGVMSRQDAEKTLGELMGSINAENENSSQKGCLRLEMILKKLDTEENQWYLESKHFPYFYFWKGQLKLTAPTNILNKIILPIVKFAVSVGGVGRGWRRPLHIFKTKNGTKWARGCHLILNHKVKDKTTKQEKTKLFALSPNQAQTWQTAYQKWLKSVKEIWGNTVSIDDDANKNLEAEVFSPHTCSVYVVPYPKEDPLDRKNNTWGDFEDLEDTRGKGMNLIYNPTYKKKQDVGGNAGGGSAHCSWVSIKRVNVAHPEIEDSKCQEVVCLFMGGISVNNPNHLRARFLRDLAEINGSRNLLGLTPPNPK